jgi:class 3 adenylate cyclase/streptogramin lyase
VRGPRRSDAVDDRVITTVLFTDIVGSTELATSLGDRQWRHVLAMHHAFIRGLLKRYGGREIDTAGDGFFVTFEQPARAIRCASDIAGGLWTRGLAIRAGLHVGEVERSVAKVGGIAVHIGSRVASAAAPGEVLVSGTLRDLVSGSAFTFVDRGRRELKGVGEWHLFAVAREDAPDGTPVAPPPPMAVQATSGRPWYRRRAVLALGVPVLAVITGLVLFALAFPSLNTVVPGPDSLARLDVGVNRFVAVLPVGRDPSAVVEGAGSLWVLNADDQTVSRVDPVSNVVIATRAVGGTPTGITFGGGSVWIVAGFGLTSGAEGSVLGLDPVTNELGRPIAVGNGLYGIAFGYGSLWVSNKNDGTVVRIDPDTGGLVAAIAVGGGPQGITVGGGGVWVAESLAAVVVRIDPKTNTVVSEVPIRQVSDAIAASDDAVWAVSTAANLVTRIDPRSGTIVTTIELSGSPVAVVVTDGAAWVAESEAEGIAKIDADTNLQKAFIGVKGRPWGMVAADQFVWVTIRP